MSQAKTTLLKIGGSVITDKDGELAAKTQEIDRLAEEIQRANPQNLIVVHGGGSFGHPPAERYGIKDGFKQDSQRIGFSETHHMMTVLNGLIMDSLILHKVPAVSVTPSSFLITENGRIKRLEGSLIETLLKMRFTPVLYGDAVLDTKLGFTILSGDQLISVLAVNLNAKQIVIGVDVDGLCEADPKVEKTAKIFTHLTLEQLEGLVNSLSKPAAHDVTGGMYGKVSELIPAIKKDIPVTIVNATKRDNVYKALTGGKVEGTVIEKGSR